MRHSSVLISTLVLVLGASEAFAQVRVRGYTRKDGTYVQSHMRSRPNSTTADNYSTKGNVNPYTGQVGTKNPSAGISIPRTTRLSYGTLSRSSSGSTYRSRLLRSGGGSSGYPVYGPSAIFGSNPQCSLTVGELNAVANGKELVVMGSGCMVHIGGR